MRANFLALLLLLAPAQALAAPGDFVLVRARGIASTIEYTNTYPATWDEDHKPGEESVIIGGYFRGRFHIHEVLGGALNRKRLTLKLTMANELVTMPEMFLLLDMRKKRDITAMWWDRAGAGFCLKPYQVHDLNLEAAAAAAARKYPCQKSGAAP